jgi:parallel beta-helix repeat protein
VSLQTWIDFKEGKKKAMKEKMIMRKVLCCLVVIAILMSTMPVSVFAVQEPSSSGTVSAQGDQGDCSSVVKFEGTATTNEKRDGSFYDNYYCKVKVEKLLSNPGNKLKSGNVYTVYYGDSSKSIKTGDKLEVYGIYYHTCGPLQGIGSIGIRSGYTDGYYIKKKGSQEETKPTHPYPKIVEVKFPPACVKEDEYATISVTVANNGGASSEGYISVSFPNDEDVYVVSGTGNEYNKVYQKDKDLIWNSAGVQMKAVDPLVELFERNWDAGESHTLTMNVKPNSGSDEIVFYVRAALKNDADESYERYPNSGYKDQQGWYVKKYSVDVCSKPDLIDVNIKNRFDDKTPQYIHDVFTWVKCVVDKMLRDAFLSFANAPNEPGVYIDNTINLKFENYQEIHKVSGIFGTDYFRWDKITFNTAGNGVYTRNIQIESPVKWRYDAVNTIFKSLSGTGKLPNVPEIGPDTLPEVRLQSVVVELNDGSTVTFEINECLKMFSKSNTFPTLVNRDLDNIVANCPIHLLVIDKQGRKVGIEKSSMSYLEFHEIPNAIYSGDTEPEYIILCDIPEYYVVIQAVEEGKFNFKIDRSTTKTTMTYLDVPVTETTIATVAVSTANPTYTMEIDNDGDGITDYTNEPDSIETIGSESPVHNLNTGEDFATIQNAIDDLDTQDGNTITVDPGTYTEHLVIDKPLKLIGKDKSTTIINGDGRFSGKCVIVTADNVEISGFTIQNSTYGIWLESSDGCTINRNIIQDNSDGIHLTDSNNNAITNNILFNNVFSISGIHLSSSHDNVIRDNDLVENGRGVSLSDSNNNRIYHNNFVDGIFRQAYDNTGTNSWDNGPTAGGNVPRIRWMVKRKSTACQSHVIT